MSSKAAQHDPATVAKDAGTAQPTKSSRRAALLSRKKLASRSQPSALPLRDELDCYTGTRSASKSFESALEHPFDERREQPSAKASTVVAEPSTPVTSAASTSSRTTMTINTRTEQDDLADGTNPSEAFHHSADAAITAILTPRRPDATSVYSDTASRLTNMPSPCANVEEEIAKKKTRYNLISEATRKKLELIKDKLREPDENFSGLLEAIMSPEDRTTMDGGYIVRRKNACGTLQVLTSDAKKRIHLCWTTGVLPALTSVILDCADEGVDFTLPDKRQREDLTAARSRALMCLWNLAVPKENRLLICHSPQLIQGLLEITTTDYGEGRRQACGILALLAKSVENRLIMAQIPGLLTSTLQVLEPASLQARAAAHVLSLSSSSGTASSDGTSESEPSSIGGSDFSQDEEDLSNDQQTHISADDDRQAFFSHGLFAQFTEQPSGTMLSKSGTLEQSFSGSGKSSFSSVFESEDTDDSEELDSFETFGTNPSCSYDESADEELRTARKNAFAMMFSLSKSKDNAFLFARDTAITDTLLRVATYETSECQGLAVKVLANLARHPLNWKIMMNFSLMVPILVRTLQVQDDESRKYACLAIQNLSQFRPSLAHADKLIKCVCDIAEHHEDIDARHAAVATLKNLSIEPTNLIFMANTRNCIATLMQLAHSEDATITEMIRFHACDTLAALSHWLGKLASSGYAEASRKSKGNLPSSVLIPSLEVQTWNQWH